MVAHIIYRNYLTPDGEKMSIGGIQTYISHLIPVIKNCGYEVTVYQLSDVDFEKYFEDTHIIGYAKSKCKKNEAKYMFQRCRNRVNEIEDIIVFGCETFACNTGNIRNIGIQHGITWDQPRKEGCSEFMFDVYYFYQAIKGYKTIKRISKVQNLVCVDYNFVNWYRAVVAHPKLQFKVIPNFTAIPEKNTGKHENNNRINIIFARRLAVYRGTRLFTEAVLEILEKYDNVYITVAGTGEDKDWMNHYLGQHKHVKFITYNSSDSLKIHQEQHIAVIPTLGSEGTSLSLLEAMASSCAVICSNVGGMSNIVLDGFNGRIINPEKEQLISALSDLIQHSEYRSKLAENAYETVSQAFALAEWQQKWKHMIEHISEEKNEGNKSAGI